MEATDPRVLITFDVTDWPESQRRSFSRRAEAIVSDISAAADAGMANGGWSNDSLMTMINRLAVCGADVQARAIMKAIENGGHVSREEVFTIGGYDPTTRSLKGFTRPINRIVRQMKDSGELPVDAVDPFGSVYDPQVKGYQQTRGFDMPSSVVDAYFPR